MLSTIKGALRPLSVVVTTNTRIDTLLNVEVK